MMYRMDKSWMSMERTNIKFIEGVEIFLRFASDNSTEKDRIRCPCLKCANLKIFSVVEVRNHIYHNGIDSGYTNWYRHGETRKKSSKVYPPEEFSDLNPRENDFTNSANNFENDNFDENNMSDMQDIMEDAIKPLYQGCNKFTKLSGSVSLYKWKGKHGHSDTSFNELLTLLSEMFPEDNVLPSSTNEVKKILREMGMNYEKIHACPNDCILYRNEYNDSISCPHCQKSRWKVNPISGKEKVNVPAKVLWYFPPIPRFKKMFQDSATSQNLTWHAKERENDGMLRHPSDSPEWKHVDYTWPEFSAESRNLRLALSSDGINPHRSLSSRYSCWPVILVIYNLPPWLCMKRKYMMLTLLISGPKQPGNDIDIYLEPLIEDLKLLWTDGIDVYDSFKLEKFKLKAILLWTINDFPAYGNLSGHAVKGYYACPVCSEGYQGLRLKHSRKMSYMGHRKWLPRYHPYRKQVKSFNGHEEEGTQPTPLTGSEILARVEMMTFARGKVNYKVDTSTPWRKKSIFFDLEYWKFLNVRHLLDVMHIEKNVCDSIVGTLLNIPGKTKDGVRQRMDLIKMGVRTEISPKVGTNKTYLPPTCYTLSTKEKKSFCNTLANLKVPDGYSSNISSLVSLTDKKLYGMKSHDCHVLMQQLLPVALRGVLPKEVRSTIIKFCYFFNDICKKKVDVQKLDAIQSELVVTLCKLEKFFPPSFFDVMIHLTIHLVREVKLCGPVFLRWMYPFERLMKELKGYVRNKNRPE